MQPTSKIMDSSKNEVQKSIIKSSIVSCGIWNKAIAPTSNHSNPQLDFITKIHDRL